MKKNWNEIRKKTKSRLIDAIQYHLSNDQIKRKRNGQIKPIKPKHHWNWIIVNGYIEYYNRLVFRESLKLIVNSNQTKSKNPWLIADSDLAKYRRA